MKKELFPKGLIKKPWRTFEEMSRDACIYFWGLPFHMIEGLAQDFADPIGNENRRRLAKLALFWKRYVLILSLYNIETPDDIDSSNAKEL